MSALLRSALVGGLTATFVVAAAFAPRLLDGPDEVRIQQATADDTTTTIESVTTVSEFDSVIALEWDGGSMANPGLVAGDGGPRAGLK